MRITGVETTVLRLPDVVATGDGLQDLLLIEIHTNEGISGIGEAHTMPNALDAIIHAPTSQWAVQGLEQLLIGRDPTDIDDIWQTMWRQCVSVLGGRGLALHAMSGVDLALWDLAGKISGLPLHEVLGGAVHESVDVYASDLMPATPEEVLLKGQARREEGYRALKFGWGKLGLSPEDDVALLAELRQQLGHEFKLMVDIGVPMKLDDAQRLANQLAPLDIAFLEEPLEATDLDGYASLVKASPVPIAAGEREGGVHGFSDLLDRANLPIVQPDLARCGGITVARKIAKIAAARGAWMVPHCWSSDVLVAASAHLLAALDQPCLLEFNVMEQPLRTQLIVSPFRPSAGRLSLPTGPGLGIEIDRDVVERYRVDA